MSRFESGPQEQSLLVLDDLAAALCDGMQVSLAVVADVRDGEDLEGIESDFANSTKGNVNPGAIGANGIFSSVNRVDDSENERGLATQRIIVGSWLLMREACDAIASVMTAPGSSLSEHQSNTAGTLLISTLTSLKNTGAAYSAHTVLQQIARACLEKHELNVLPSQWVGRLFREITSTEKIRDSTLRRSTGYALGFLAVMRSEVSLRRSSRNISCMVAQRLLLSTLPNFGQLSSFIVKIGVTGQSKLFSYLQDNSATIEGQTVRCRVHSLNVLRMMILDAPLSNEMAPLVGDAIVSAIIGYVDSEWSIRNSAGMVFAAAMLRVIDADKNAVNTDTTSKNAITLTELFQCYPALSGVLLGVLSACVDGDLKVEGGGALPPILPILVLFYRVQPLAICDADVVEKMQQFHRVIMSCLGHGHLRVRDAAARALCNLSCEGRQRPLSVEKLHFECLQNLQKSTNWNQVHGSLLLLRELHVSGRSAADDLITSPSFNTIFSMFQTTAQELLAPRLCVIAAIRLLETIKGSPESQSVFTEACLRLIEWIAEDKKRQEIVGVSGLCSACASTAVSRIASLLFEEARFDENSNLVLKFSYLLECPVIDARIAAVKALKKRIYAGVDRLVSHLRHLAMHGIQVSLFWQGY